MGYSYTKGRNLYGRITNSSDSTHLNDGDEAINESIKTIMSISPWTFLEHKDTLETVASQREYTIPNSLDNTLNDLYIDVNDTIYSPRSVEGISDWKIILAGQSGESEVQNFWYISGNKIEFDPIPATSGHTINIYGTKRFSGLSAEDYAEGVIFISSGSVEVEGAGGASFASTMAGRFIKFTEGDNLLYKIASVTDSTNLVLETPYEGVSISGGGGDYIIGEYAPLPEEFQSMPIYRAAAIYWEYNADVTRSERLWRLYDRMVEEMRDKYSAKTTSPYSNNRFTVRDPNTPPTNIDSSNFT